MKKITLILALVSVFACKEDKKENITNEKQEPVKVVEERFETIKKFEVKDLIIWSKTRVDLTETTDVDFMETPYHLARNSADESSFLTTNPIPVEFDHNYKASVIVKKGANTSFFGLRLSGAYPDRVDAIFNLETGILKGVKSSRDFIEEDATIEALGDGWYKCTVRAETPAENVRIIFGPTSNDKDIIGWEGKTGQKGDVYFIPSSVILEEIIID